MKDSFHNNYRTVNALGVLGIVLLLILYDFYRESLPYFLEYWAGGALYVLFWIFLVYSISPRNFNPIAICILTTLTTCIIEFTQLWHPLWLEEIRSYKIGYAILGTTFSWTDFPPYFLGGVLGYLAYKLFQVLSSSPTPLPEWGGANSKKGGRREDEQEG